MAGDLYKQQTEQTPCKCFICGSVYNLITKCPKLLKDKDKFQKQVCFNERVNGALQKICEKGDDDNDQKIYAFMAQIFGNDKSYSKDFVDTLHLNNCILDSGTMCHMTPQVSYLIPVLLEDTGKYIGIAEGHHVTAQQKVTVQIKMCNNNGDTYIVTLHNVLLEPDLCNTLISIVTLINLGHNCSFHKGFCMVYFVDKEKNAVTLPHSLQRRHAFWGE